MKIFASYSIKGGVGKTATAVNLAYLSALEGARTLLWDLDPQGAATFYFRIKPKVKGGAKKLLRHRDLEPLVRGTDFSRLDLIPADFRYRELDQRLGDLKKPSKQLARLLAPLEEEYDHVFLDCAPSISLVSEAVFLASDVLLVPVIPTPLSLRTLEQLTGHLAESGPSRLAALPFFSMVDRRKSIHRTIPESDTARRFGALKAQIPYSSLVEQMGMERAPVGAYASWSAPARAYEKLWQEICRSV